MRRSRRIALVATMLAVCGLFAAAIGFVLHLRSATQRVRCILAEARGEKLSYADQFLAWVGLAGQLPSDPPPAAAPPSALRITPKQEACGAKSAALGPDAVPALLEAMRSPRESDRNVAICALTAIGSPKAADAVVPVLLAAVEASPEPVPTSLPAEAVVLQRLLRATRAPDDATRSAATEALLGVFEPRRALRSPKESHLPPRRTTDLPRRVEWLLIYQPPNYEDRIDELYRESHHDAEIQSPHRLLPLTRRDEQEMLNDLAGVLRHGYDMRPPRSPEEVQRRRPLLRLLGRTGDSRALAVLIRALKDPSPPLRAEAARGLGRIRALVAAEPLAALQSDPAQPAEVREAASEALAALAKVHSAEEMAAWTDPPLPTLAETVQDALDRLTRPMRPKTDPASRPGPKRKPSPTPSSPSGRSPR